MKNELYEKLLEKIGLYVKSLENVGFAHYEMEKLRKTPENESELLEALDVIMSSSKELNYIIEEAPNSFFVCDSEGICLRVNKSFEKMVKMSKHEIYGESMQEMDVSEIFRPSVCWLTLKEKRTVSVLQEIRDVDNMVVTGVPVFDEHGDLFRVITNAIKIDEVEPLKRYIQNQNQPTRQSEGCTSLIAESDKMKEVVALADLVKNTESSILITGETGVGKGVLASYIHETGSRKDGKIISINCGAIPENLLESELFGYESGAFTGADKKGKPGLIELSDRGTLFLDEISELPLMLQVKILHFLQTKKLMRVGGTKELRVDTRIIAASNKPLEEEVRKGTFRADLYYRINVIPINIPPLRERREDLKALTVHFMDVYMKKYNKVMKIDDASMDFIMSYEWLGNVRELENYVERMVVTNDSGWTLSTDMGELIKQKDDPANTFIENSMSEKDIIIKTYEKYKSSYKVAEVLGLSQSTA